MFRLSLRKAFEGSGRGICWEWTNTPAMFAIAFAHQARLNSQKGLTTAFGGSLYGTEHQLGSAEMRKQVQFYGNVFSGKSHLTSGSRSQAVDTTTFKAVAVQVGTLLKIDLSGTKASIKALVGDNLEEISVQPSCTDSSDKGARCEALTLSHSQDTVLLKKTEPLDQNKMQLSKLQELIVHIPARWCSLNVQTSEGPVYVQNVREGSLRVTTAGGNVKLGEMKGGEAFIETQGGEFEAKVVQARSCVNTKGGKLYVDKLQGDVINLDSGGGEIAIGTLYGNDVRVQSGGGPVGARHMHAQQIAHVSSDGGPIAITGFDGSGVFVSKGGRIELQLSDHAEEVSIYATDGEVVLSLSSKLIAQLTFEGAQGRVLHNDILRSTGVSNVYHYSGSESVSRKLGHDLVTWRGSENDLRSANDDTVSCKIVVSTVGNLLVEQKCWLDLI